MVRAKSAAGRSGTFAKSNRRANDSPSVGTAGTATRWSTPMTSDAPTCEDCGAIKTQVRDRRYNSGYRWRCPNCEAA